MLTIQDFDRFNDTLLGRVMNKDFKNLETDLMKVVEGKVEKRVEAARDEWRENCRK